MQKVENDLAKLDEIIRRLEVEYDQFLSGQERIQPWRTEGAVKALIKAYGGRAIQNSTMRFRYNSLVSKYNALCRVWTRRMREKEEGRAFGMPLKAGRKVRQAPLPPKPAARAPQEKKSAFNCGPGMNEDTMKDLFDNYKNLRQECGESTERLRMESFQRIISDKVEKIKKSYNCDNVEIMLDRSGTKSRIVVRAKRGKKQSAARTD